MQEVGFISTIIIVKITIGVVRGCFNSLQEVGFISTPLTSPVVWVAYVSFNSLQEVGFISTSGFVMGVDSRGWGFNSLQEVGFISTEHLSEGDIHAAFVSIPCRK